MKLSLSWLREFVSVKLTAEQLAERLTMAGIEVEQVTDRGRDFDKVVVGEVVDLKPHPNADKLRLAKVVTTRGGQPQEIVCGAPNVAVGQKVAVALLGAKLPSGLTIAARPIRGVVSQGMVCSERELGLGTDQNGIMVLDPNLETGMSFATAMGFDEVVLDIAVPANRGDLMSVRGLAWEVAAITGRTFKDKPVDVRESATLAARSVRVKIEAPALCPVYTARVIRGLEIKPSPPWLQQRLRAAGIRPVNALVDVTNYVMVEYGQPLHAFDAAKVHGAIVIRTARVGERLITLDGVERKLEPSMLVVADSQGPIALAGVMGGAHTQINDQTTAVILESAVFDPVSVRKTSRKLGLISESSRRFEKGITVQLPAQASAAAAALMAKRCGGTVDKGTVRAGRRPDRPTVVKVSPSYISELLGLAVAPTKAKQVLTKLGFGVRGTVKQWTVTVPFWRRDVTLPEDVVEEVGRLVGYDKLPEELPLIPTVPMPVPSLVQLKDEIRDVLVQLGFTEVMTHAFYGNPWVNTEYTSGPHFDIANPLDKSQHHLRRSIIPQLHSILWHEVDAGRDAKVFQIGRVFLPTSGKPIEAQQPWKIVIGLSFKSRRGYSKARKIKGVIESLLEALGVLPSKIPVHLYEGELKGRVVEWCELDVVELRDRRQPKRFTPLPTFPAIRRDVSFWLKENVRYVDIEKTIRQAGQPLLESVELFDVFEQAGRRSYALHLTFRAPDRTLTDSEISAKMKVINEALKRLGATIR
ncbi:MAG: phenylalanine--tRNA ligase subunit beta [Candidatus Kerfeldbacteria bacterium]|nr:phenylalanine--tRNA ligase subunit beta [Candidatus Kerfeldbacteria bacterium]